MNAHKKLIAQHAQLLKAYKTLDFAVHYPSENSHHITAELRTIYRDSRIKRFCYCYVLTKNYVRNYMRVTHANKMRTAKSIFQACLTHNITSLQKTALLHEMSDAHKKSSYAYDEEIANDLEKKIPKYAHLLNTLALRIAPK